MWEEVENESSKGSWRKPQKSVVGRSPVPVTHGPVGTPHCWTSHCWGVAAQRGRPQAARDLSEVPPLSSG